MNRVFDGPSRWLLSIARPLNWLGHLCTLIGQPPYRQLPAAKIRPKDASWIELFYSLCHPPFTRDPGFEFCAAPLIFCKAEPSSPPGVFLGAIARSPLHSFISCSCSFSFPFVVLRIFSQSFCNVQFAPWASYEQKNTGECTDRNSSFSIRHSSHHSHRPGRRQLPSKCPPLKDPTVVARPSC